jgi:hypothetical protein
LPVKESTTDTLCSCLSSMFEVLYLSGRIP